MIDTPGMARLLVVLGRAAVAASGGGSHADRGGLQWLSSYDFDPVEQAGMLNLGLIHCDTKMYCLLHQLSLFIVPSMTQSLF